MTTIYFAKSMYTTNLLIRILVDNLYNENYTYTE